MIERAHSSPAEDMAKLRRSPPAMAAWQSAVQNLNNGRHAAALASYHSLIQQYPAVPQLWAELGIAAAGDLELALAGQAFGRAMELSPADSAMLVALGLQFYRLRRLDEANECFERAVALNPSSANARLNLTWWLERSRRLDEAWGCVEEWLRLLPKDGRALYYKAFLLHRKKQTQEAKTALLDLLQSNPMPPLDVQADAYYLLGTVQDELGEYAEALGSLSKAKALRCKTINVESVEQNFSKVDETRRALVAKLTPQMLKRWREETSDESCPHQLALLAGAPRSGTTLMEQILGAQPNILVFDESDAFSQELLSRLLPPSTWGFSLDGLNGLKPKENSRLIGRYFKSLLRETDEAPGGKLLLDKNPSTTAWLHVWLRLFPKSKVIIALRDPRDIMISCYFQNVPAHWGTVCYRSLERIVDFYAACMDVWLRLRELGGFDWIETRYEDVVGNVSQEGNRVTSFLGLPWNEAQAAFHEKAAGKFVHSPTYNDVAKPIHKKAMGRWEHYADALAPHQARLKPYLRAFGYE